MKPSVFLWIGSLLIGLLVSCSPQVKQRDSYAKFTPYQTQRYSIMVPNNWRLDTSGYQGSEFAIFSRQTSLLDKFIENVTLKQFQLADSIPSLSEFMTDVEAKAKTLSTDHTLMESSRLHAQGKEYHKLVYTERKPIYILQHVQYYWFQDRKAYVLTFSGKVNEYKNYQKTSMLIMDSFVLYD